MIDDGSCCICPSLLISIQIQVNTNYDLAAMESGSIITVQSINPRHFSHLAVQLLSPAALGNCVQWPSTALSIDCALSPLAAQRGQCVTARRRLQSPSPRLGSVGSCNIYPLLHHLSSSAERTRHFGPHAISPPRA